MEKPLVSVILITYRKFENIYGVLDSILEQDYPKLELIIQDDASPEFETNREPINQYVTEHKRENVVRFVINHLENNVGTSKNINKGIEDAKGSYVKLATADDGFYSQDMITKCVDFSIENDARILVGQTFVHRRDNSVIDEVEDTIRYRWQSRHGKKCTLAPSNRDIDYLAGLSKEKCNRIIASRCIISTISVFYRMDLLQETNGFPEKYRLVEDMPYWPMLALKGEKFYFSHIRMMDYILDGISNGGAQYNIFSKDYNEIMNTIYIPNEYRGGIFNSYLKSIRQKACCVGENKQMSIEANLYNVWQGIKYLLLGTKL